MNDLLLSVLRRLGTICLLGLATLCPAEEPNAGPQAIEGFTLTTDADGTFRPGTWALLKISLRNPQDRDLELLATTCLEADPNLQYGRRLWIPARSRLLTWHPLKVPPLEKPDQQLFELRSLVLSTSDDGERAAVNEFGAMRFDHAFRAAVDEPATAMIAPQKLIDQDPSWPDAQDFALTARVHRGLHHNFTLLRNPLLPAGEELLDGVDHLVIADDRLLPDAAAAGAIRRWVVSGGRLWIMAEAVSPDLLAALLGDEDAVTEVDRVDLTSVNMAAAQGVGGSLEFSRELERPVRFVRVIAEGMEVVFHIDGWPAAFWKPYGAGRILVTTAGPDAWLRPRPPGDRAAPGAKRFQTAFAPGGPLVILALEFFVPRKPPLLSREIAEDEVRQMIGYAIPGRPFVLGTLIGFTALMLIAAVWLRRRGRLELMGLAVPGLAIVSAGALLGAGFSSRSTIPASTAMVQLVEAVPGTDEIRTSGMAGVFAKESHAEDLSGTQGGWMTPEMAGLEGTARRMVWTDIDQWHWENLVAKPGLRMVAFQTAGRLDQAMEAVAAFDARGIAGKMSLPAGLDPADAVIVTAQGRMGVELGSDGEFTSAAGAVLRADQYLSALVLSDEQQRRRRVLSGMLSAAPVREPALLVWTRPWEAGTSLMRGDRTVGSALVTMPLRWQRPPAGSPLTIPSPFLSVREAKGPDGMAPSGLYDHRHGQWMERTGATAGWLAFTVPEHLLPLIVDSATLTFKVRGPLGRLELSTVADDRRVSLKAWENPVGTLTHTIRDSKGLKLDARGRWLIRVDIGQSTNGSNTAKTLEAESLNYDPSEASDPTSYWQFEDVSLQLEAEIPSQEKQR